MGSNSKLIVSDCTCNDNVTVPNLIQSKERIAESTGLFFFCFFFFHATKSDIQYAGQLAHRQRTGIGLNAE